MTRTPSKRQLASRHELWEIEVTRMLPKLLDALLSSPNCASAPPKTHGVYLFSDSGIPAYVGRMGRTERSMVKGRGHSNFRTRRAGHTRARHNEGTFAYRLAVKEFQQKRKHLAATRAANCENAAFKREFERQCVRVKAMEFRVIEIGDNKLAAVFEVYAATILKTSNSWATS